MFMSTTVATAPQIGSQPQISPGKEITPEELLMMPDEKHYELIDGELVERNMSVLSGLVATRVSRLLGNHCDERNLGWVLGSEVGYQCFDWKPKLVRRADVSFISIERYSLEQVSEEGYASIAPDLAVEVVSPDDLAGKLKAKLEAYRRAGVKLIWVICPELRILDIHHPDGTSVRLREGDEVTGEDVIPGFRSVVSAFFPAVPESGAAPTSSDIP
jgi:Uma2 family endonuclease